MPDATSRTRIRRHRHRRPPVISTKVCDRCRGVVRRCGCPSMRGWGIAPARFPPPARDSTSGRDPERGRLDLATRSRECYESCCRREAGNRRPCRRSRWRTSSFCNPTASSGCPNSFFCGIRRAVGWCNTESRVRRRCAQKRPPLHNSKTKDNFIDIKKVMLRVT